MLINKITRVAKLVEKFTADNSPLILTSIGVAGTITTAILAGKASYKAALIIDEAEKEAIDNATTPTEATVTRKQKLKLIWPLYIAAVSTGAATVTCIILANKIGTKRAAALAAAYTTLDQSFAEYRDKIVEKMGENKERAARAELAQDQVNRHPMSQGSVIISKDGGVPVFDQWSARYFMSSMEDIKRCVNNMNYRIISQNYACLNDFYDMLGLQGTGDGDEIGWSTNEKFDIQFDTTMTDDGRPAIHISFRAKPIRGYFKVHG